MDELKGPALIHQIDGDGYFIYVTRRWYQLTIDEKQAAALVAATCVGKDGKARFLDSYTGKLLARWNGTAFVNEMNR
jgi:hypothetical protein